MAEWIAAAVPAARVVKAFNLCHEDVWRKYCHLWWPAQGRSTRRPAVATPSSPR